MKLWVWFIAGSVTGLLAASVFTPVDAAEPVAGGFVSQIVRTWSGVSSELGAFELKEVGSNRWELVQDFNACTPQKECTQISSAHYDFRTTQIEQRENEVRILLAAVQGKYSFSAYLVQTLRANSPLRLEISGILPGVAAVFDGATTVELH